MSKFVKFYPVVKVVLIPSKEEYFEANLNNFIWYNREEIYNFKKFIDNEMKVLVWFYHGDVEKAKNQWRKNIL